MNILMYCINIGSGSNWNKHWVHGCFGAEERFEYEEQGWSSCWDIRICICDWSWNVDNEQEVVVFMEEVLKTNMMMIKCWPGRVDENKDSSGKQFGEWVGARWNRCRKVDKNAGEAAGLLFTHCRLLWVFTEPN